MSDEPVTGRFAPTPSGPLHFGSLVTAVASYCHAKAQHGRWLVRIEDVDTPRVVNGSIDHILQVLEAFGFEWDGQIEYQRDHFDRYRQVLQSLFDQHLCYACECSRKTLRDANAQSGPLGLVYPEFCRLKSLGQKGHSVRINTEGCGIVHYIDQVHGKVGFNIEKQLGDFVLRRADGIYAYHLAVVIDDEQQGVNQIVRGADLLEATCLHLFLQKALGYKTPQYLHIPLVRNKKGHKLSKQTGATAVNLNDKSSLLIEALAILGQPVDREMEQASAKEILISAIANWNHHNIAVPSGDIY
ncbi:MAG: tRNA glutamyl-Q(34) synthetase GluQRS [Gammaproteobacteria bacterium]|nr:tRNA glutamyl-Q(34) synthetase GluQRS [Gammaproteobacteria bacterium]